MAPRVSLDAVLDPAAARVVLTRDADGTLTDAAFDLAGLPRVDALLAGRPVADVPALVERLCSICPAAHHLAGVRALEALAGGVTIPPAAEAVRRLLHHASVVAMHVVGFFAADPADAACLRRFAKAGMAAAGSPGHFPATAIPGGVTATVVPAARDDCLGALPDALAAARRLAERTVGEARTDAFDGADVALVDAAGRLDLFGSRLRAVAADGTVVIDGASPQEWDDLVVEAVPGSPAPRPYLVALGADRGAYRVGPVAQLRIGPVATPLAAAAQAAWRRDGGGAAAARAIVVLHAVEVIAGLLGEADRFAGPSAVPVREGAGSSIGVGWVDGARGLLVHRYEVGMDGVLSRATILTPTAQNEPWLGELLRAAATGEPATDRLEEAIREADPCLPCSTAPAGTMGLVVDTVRPSRKEP